MKVSLLSFEKKNYPHIKCESWIPKDFRLLLRVCVYLLLLEFLDVQLHRGILAYQWVLVLPSVLVLLKNININAEHTLIGKIGISYNILSLSNVTFDHHFERAQAITKVYMISTYVLLSVRRQLRIA